MVFQHGAGEGVDFAERYRLPSEWPPRDGRGLDAAEQADVFEFAHVSCGGVRWIPVWSW